MNQQLTLASQDRVFPTLTPVQRGAAYSVAVQGFFWGLILTAAIGGAATLTAAAAFALAGMGGKKKRKR